MYFPTSKIASGEDITAGFRVPLVKQRNKTQFAEQEPGKDCIFSSFLYMSKQRNNEKLILCRLQFVVVLSLVYVAYDTYYFLVAVATRMSSFPHQQGPQHRKGDQEFHLKKKINDSFYQQFSLPSIYANSQLPFSVQTKTNLISNVLLRDAIRRAINKQMTMIS